MQKGDSNIAGVVHPNSRKAEQLQRAALKANKKAGRARAKEDGRRDRATFLGFLQSRLQQRTCLSSSEVLEELRLWCARFDDELADLAADDRKRTRELELRMMRDEELQKLRTGYPCPDLRIKKVVQQLRDWDGGWDGMERFKDVPFREKVPTTAPTAASNE